MASNTAKEVLNCLENILDSIKIVVSKVPEGTEVGAKLEIRRSYLISNYELINARLDLIQLYSKYLPKEVFDSLYEPFLKWLYEIKMLCNRVAYWMKLEGMDSSELYKEVKKTEEDIQKIHLQISKKLRRR